MNNLHKIRLCGQLKAAPGGRLLYLTLLEICGADSKAVVSHRQLCRITGLSRAAVSRNLRRLRDAGYIAIQPQYSQWEGRLPNQYTIK